MNFVNLEQIKNILHDENYFYLGHGTGRNGDSKQVINSIFQNGLRTKDNSLYYTTIGLDTNNIKELENKLDNWSHLDSKKIILIRLPIKFINIMGNTADLDGERFGAFFTESITEDGKITYYLDTKYILGVYDVASKSVFLNENFELVLSEETIENLNEKYKKVLEKTNLRLQRQEILLNSLLQNGNIPINNQKENNSMNLNLSEFDDEIDWEVSNNLKRK